MVWLAPISFVVALLAKAGVIPVPMVLLFAVLMLLTLIGMLVLDPWHNGWRPSSQG
jgi:hypothetical protein